MECRDVRDLADPFLAEELLTETNHEILRHLDTCSRCRDDVAGRRALRERVRQAIQRAPGLEPRPEFVTELRAMLQNTARQAPPRRGIRFHGWWTLAATVLLVAALGGAYLGRDWIAVRGALARAAVGDHRYCALQFRLTERPIALAEAARRYGAVYRVVETVPPDTVTTAAGPARVLERHACVYMGRRFAHIVLEYHNQRVSLLVSNDDRGVPRAGRPDITSARIDQMPVAYFRAAGQVVFLAGDVAQSDLAALAAAVAEPLSRALAGA